MNEEQWEDEYKPIKNHIDTNASFDGYAFETFDEELEFVKKADPKKVWTIVEGDDNEIYYVSGFHYVNRLSYIITEKSWTEEITIKLES